VVDATRAYLLHLSHCSSSPHAWFCGTNTTPFSALLLRWALFCQGIRHTLRLRYHHTAHAPRSTPTSALFVPWLPHTAYAPLPHYLPCAPVTYRPTYPRDISVLLRYWIISFCLVLILMPALQFLSFCLWSSSNSVTFSACLPCCLRTFATTTTSSPALPPSTAFCLLLPGCCYRSGLPLRARHAVTFTTLYSHCCLAHPPLPRVSLRYRAVATPHLPLVAGHRGAHTRTCSSERCRYHTPVAALPPPPAADVA